VSLTQHKQQTTQQSKSDNMRDKKKKNIKVRDLKPSKDAKGGSNKIQSGGGVKGGVTTSGK
jgi:hypothetical protein